MFSAAAVAKMCLIELKLQAPDSWQVTKIQDVLRGATAMLKDRFQVEIVYVGSLITVTSIPNVILQHVELLPSSIRFFLQYIDVCELKTEIPEPVVVDFTVLNGIMQNRKMN